MRRFAEGSLVVTCKRLSPGHLPRRQPILVPIWFQGPNMPGASAGWLRPRWLWRALAGSPADGLFVPACVLN
ncbi:MAG: hypothetical protein KatS3mg110_2523 [Pirellulaceae bacterium]|nr:MAG: hypothetical protein KatS3mg110_2523 [Pirellulaceae bacterium]